MAQNRREEFTCPLPPGLIYFLVANLDCWVGKLRSRVDDWGQIGYQITTELSQEESKNREKSNNNNK